MQQRHPSPHKEGRPCHTHSRGRCILRGVGQRLLLATALVVLAACGGGAKSKDASSAPPNSARTAPWTVTGAAVKGPLQFATVRIYSLSSSQVTGFEPAAPIAEGATDRAGALRDLEVPATAAGPLVIVVDGHNSVDLATRQPPVLTTLIALVTERDIDDGRPVYITPLTTLAFYIAQQGAGTTQAARTFAAAYNQAAWGLTRVFPVLGSKGVDVLLDPPILTTKTSSAAAQGRVLAHRIAIEGLASLVYDTLQRRQLSENTTATDTLLRAIARDIVRDGFLDGRDGLTPMDSVLPPLLTRSISEALVPNTNTPLTELMGQLTKELQFSSGTQTVSLAPLVIDGSQSLVRTRTFPATEPAAPRASPNAPPTPSVTIPAVWTLTWSPQATSILSYSVYFGRTPSGATQELTSIPLGDLADPQRPSLSIDAAALPLGAGEQGCFRVKAVNEVGASDFSAAACAVR